MSSKAIRTVYAPIRTACMFQGYPLSNIGLEGASLVYPDGTERPLTGLILQGNESPRKALERMYPGCKLVIPL